jgi:hypothetical protein
VDKRSAGFSALRPSGRTGSGRPFRRRCVDLDRAACPDRRRRPRLPRRAVPANDGEHRESGAREANSVRAALPPPRAQASLSLTGGAGSLSSHRGAVQPMAEPDARVRLHESNARLIGLDGCRR